MPCKISVPKSAMKLYLAILHFKAIGSIRPKKEDTVHYYKSLTAFIYCSVHSL